MNDKVKAKKYMFEGEEMSLAAVARRLKNHEGTFRTHVRNYGFEEAVRIGRLSPEERKAWAFEKNNAVALQKRLEAIRSKYKLYEYKGEKVTSGDLARIFNIPASTIKTWVYRYGEDRMLELAGMGVKERRSSILKEAAAKRMYYRPPTNPELPTFNPDQEHELRAENWIKLYGRDAALIKAKML